MAITVDTQFKTIGHDETWRNAVAKELNCLIQLAWGIRDTTVRPFTELEENMESHNRKLYRAILRVVERVANFEEIEEI